METTMQRCVFNWIKTQGDFLIPGQDLRESRSKIQFKAEAVRFAHDLLRFGLCESQWLTFQLRISQIKKTHRLAPNPQQKNLCHPSPLLLYYSQAQSWVIQRSMSLTHEPASEPLSIFGAVHYMLSPGMLSSTVSLFLVSKIWWGWDVSAPQVDRCVQPCVNLKPSCQLENSRSTRPRQS